MVDEKREFDAKLKEEINKLILLTHAEVIKNTPEDTGRLRSSIVVEEKDDGWIIGSNVDYAIFVELDTQPHVIKPVNAKALRFKANGELVFATKVNHPGTKGHHMFLKGVNFFETELNKL